MKPAEPVLPKPTKPGQQQPKTRAPRAASRAATKIEEKLCSLLQKIQPFPAGD